MAESTETPKLVTIAEDGNIILQPGKGDVKIELLVRADILARASNVFKKMLFGSFSEAGLVSESSPGRLSLPDDYGEGLKIFCEMIHFKFKKDTFPNFDHLRDYAVFVDKYDVSAAVYPWSKLWVNAHISSVPGPRGGSLNPDQCAELGDLLFITYALDLCEEFNQAGRLLVLNTNGNAGIDIKRHFGYEMLPDGLINAIRRQRQLQLDYIRDKVLELLDRVASDLTGDFHIQSLNCESKTTVLLKLLLSRGLLRDNEKTLREYPASITSLKNEYALVRRNRCHPNCSMCLRAVVWIGILESTIKKLVSEEIMGMCLDCAKKGKFESHDSSGCIPEGLSQPE